MGGTQLLDQFNAGQPGQVVLGDQNIVAAGLKRLPPGCAIFGDLNVVTGTSQRIGVQPAEVAVFINRENPVGGIPRACQWRGGGLSTSARSCCPSYHDT